MNRLGYARTLVALSGSCMALSCQNGGGSGGVDYPFENIILTSPNGVSGNVASGNVTLAYSRGELAPPSLDPPGTQQLLEFFPAFPGNNPRQDVVAFPLDWSSPILNPDPQIDYVPIQTQFINVVAGYGYYYTFNGTASTTAAPTSHIIRFWHGECSVRQAWPDIFDLVSQGLYDGIREGTEQQVFKIFGHTFGTPVLNRTYDTFAPMFIGYVDDIQHGFTLEGLYDATLLGSRLYSAKINPAYTLKANPDTGLVDIVTVHQGVVSIGNFLGFGNPKDALTAALKDTLPAQLMKAFNDKLTVELKAAPIDSACDPAASTADQQQECFDLVVSGTPLTGPMQQLFAAGLKATGVSPQAADALASSMAQGVKPHNFLCKENLDGLGNPDGSGNCTFHPFVKRLNVLPQDVELVLAREVTNPAIDQDGNNELLLIRYLPQVARGLVPDSAPIPIDCDKPLQSNFDVTTLTTHYGNP